MAEKRKAPAVVPMQHPEAPGSASPNGNLAGGSQLSPGAHVRAAGLHASAFLTLSASISKDVDRSMTREIGLLIFQHGGDGLSQFHSSPVGESGLHPVEVSPPTTTASTSGPRFVRAVEGIEDNTR
ncbi:unnamed protein product [Pleuronectes platessa]|uniref:Uncharacterized protein n=1 Tax=Pleuronectes platessa TaxID=8262 RepID=A0A9N7YXX4_PLEPL|nr:unnamed protein product [Pleuronectes platessa]